MSYAAAGLARGISGGLGTIAQALMGIRERGDMERELALREEQMRAEADERALDRERYNSEMGIREGFTPTQVRFGGATIGAGGTTGSAMDAPTDVFAGARPNMAPSPLAMPTEQVGGVMAGQGVGMQPSKLRGLQVAGREMIETPQVAPAPDVAFRAPFVEQDITRGTRYQNQQRLAGLEATQRERVEAPQRAAILASLPPEIAAQLEGQDLEGLLRVQADLATREPKEPRAARTGFRPNDGALVNLDTGAVITAGVPKPVEGGGPGRIPTGLPTDLKDVDKNKIEGLRIMTPLIADYRTLVTKFLDQNPVQRARAMSPLGSPEQQGLVGEISSLRETLSFAVKNLEGLGALQEGEIKLLQRMIGDALNTQAIIRDPQYTLARLDRIDAYLDEKVRAMSGTMGISEDALRGPGVFGGGDDLDATIDELIAKGASDEEIRAALAGGAG